MCEHARGASRALLSGDKHSDSWGEAAVGFAKRLLGMPARTVRISPS
jgi:hypothetical protein